MTLGGCCSRLGDKEKEVQSVEFFRNETYIPIFENPGIEQ